MRSSDGSDHPEILVLELDENLKCPSLQGWGDGEDVSFKGNFWLRTYTRRRTYIAVQEWEL